MLISIEGIDGSGKSTLIRRLRNRLEIERPEADVIMTREPWHRALEIEIRKQFEGRSEVKAPPDYMAVLFSADRALHCLDLIEPKLQDDKSILLTDRYKLSTYVYQVAFGATKNICWDLCRIFPDPNLTILLDADPEKLSDRIEARDAMENIEQQKVIRGLYMDTVESFTDDFLVVDALASTDEVLERSLAKIMEKLSYAQ